MCEACGEPFPCPDGIAIYEAVKHELSNVSHRVDPADAPELLERAQPFEPEPPPVRWEDLDDRADRCRKCLHWWVSHGVPGEDSYSCMTIESSATERWEMSQRARELQRQGVAPEVAGPQAYHDLRYCECTFANDNLVTPRQVRIWLRKPPEI